MLTSPAFAGWDAAKFVELQAQASAAFSAGSYDDAKAAYDELETMLESALNAGEIPDAQVEQARNALPAIRYQLGRVHQARGECLDAHQRFESLARGSDPGLDAKIATRVSESALCATLEAIRSKDADAARAYLAYTDPTDIGALNEAEREALGGDPAARLSDERKSARALMTTTREALYDLEHDILGDAIAAGECDRAKSLYKAMSADVPPGRNANAIEAETRLSSHCGEVESVTPPGESDGGGVSLGVWILGGVGAAVLLGDLGFELATASTVSDYDAADSDCRARRERCQEALDLAADIDTAKIVSISLLAVGGAALVGSIVWLVVDLTSEETPSAGVSVVPLDGGGLVSGTVRF